MHAVTPHLIAFVFMQDIVSTCIPRYVNTERSLILLASCEPWQHVNVFFYFLDEGRKIVETLALLTTELSSYKLCKVL